MKKHEIPTSHSVKSTASNQNQPTSRPLPPTPPAKKSNIVPKKPEIKPVIISPPQRPPVRKLPPLPSKKPAAKPLETSVTNSPSVNTQQIGEEYSSLNPHTRITQLLHSLPYPPADTPKQEIKKSTTATKPRPASVINLTSITTISVTSPILPNRANAISSNNNPSPRPKSGTGDKKNLPLQQLPQEFSQKLIPHSSVGNRNSASPKFFTMNKTALQAAAAAAKQGGKKPTAEEMINFIALKEFTSVVEVSLIDFLPEIMAFSEKIQKGEFLESILFLEYALLIASESPMVNPLVQSFCSQWAKELRVPESIQKELTKEELIESTVFACHQLQNEFSKNSILKIILQHSSINNPLLLLYIGFLQGKNILSAHAYFNQAKQKDKDEQGLFDLFVTQYKAYLVKQRQAQQSCKVSMLVILGLIYFEQNDSDNSAECFKIAGFLNFKEFKSLFSNTTLFEKDSVEKTPAIQYLKQSASSNINNSFPPHQTSSLPITKVIKNYKNMIFEKIKNHAANAAILNKKIDLGDMMPLLITIPKSIIRKNFSEYVICLPFSFKNPEASTKKLPTNATEKLPTAIRERLFKFAIYKAKKHYPEIKRVPNLLDELTYHFQDSTLTILFLEINFNLLSNFISQATILSNFIPEIIKISHQIRNSDFPGCAIFFGYILGEFSKVTNFNALMKIFYCQWAKALSPTEKTLDEIATSAVAFFHQLQVGGFNTLPQFLKLCSTTTIDTPLTALVFNMPLIEKPTENNEDIMELPVFLGAILKNNEEFFNLFIDKGIAENYFSFRTIISVGLTYSFAGQFDRSKKVFQAASNYDGEQFKNIFKIMYIFKPGSHEERIAQKIVDETEDLSSHSSKQFSR